MVVSGTRIIEQISLLIIFFARKLLIFYCDLFTFATPKHETSHVKTSQLNYYQYHSPGFKQPKVSMRVDILSQLVEQLTGNPKDAYQVQIMSEDNFFALLIFK